MYAVRCGQTDLTGIFDSLHHTHVCVGQWMGLFTRLTNTCCGKASWKYKNTNEHSTLMSPITSDPMWQDECNLSAKISSDGYWHDFVRLSVELHSQYMFVVDVLLKLFFMNLFLLCHANKKPQIFFQQISRHTIPVCSLSCVMLERFENSIGQQVQINYIQHVDALCVIHNSRIDWSFGLCWVLRLAAFAYFHAHMK